MDGDAWSTQKYIELQGIDMKHARIASTNGVEPIVLDRALLKDAFVEAEASARIEGLTLSSLALAQAALVIEGCASFDDAIMELKQHYSQPR